MHIKVVFWCSKMIVCKYCSRQQHWLNNNGMVPSLLSFLVFQFLMILIRERGKWLFECKVSKFQSSTVNDKSHNIEAALERRSKWTQWKSGRGPIFIYLVLSVVRYWNIQSSSSAENSRMHWLYAGELRLTF